MADLHDERLYLTETEREHFQQWEYFFASAGWTFLTNEINEEVAQLPTHILTNAKSWDDILEGRARMRVLLELLAYPSLVDTRKEHAILSRAQQAELFDDLDNPEV